jgi:hypothetical protein
MAAGAAALMLLILVAVRLVPAYWRNLEFQRTLERVATAGLTSGAPDEAIRVAAVNAAARLGLGVGFEQVTLKRAEGRLEVQALYVVPVDLPLYTVDLHFRTRVRVP